MLIFLYLLSWRGGGGGCRGEIIELKTLYSCIGSLGDGFLTGGGDLRDDQESVAFKLCSPAPKGLRSRWGCSRVRGGPLGINENNSALISSRISLPVKISLTLQIIHY